MTKIYLIRHAEAEGNVYRRIHGQYDSLVTENGKKQIAALAKRFENVPIAACYSSDLTRTKLTAQAICVPHHLTLQTDPRFREVNMGIWEEHTFGEIAHTEPEELSRFNNDPEHWLVEGSEPFDVYTGRFLEAMTEKAQAHPGQTIAIVAHGAVIRGILQRLFFYGDKEQAGHCDNTGVALLTYEDGRYTLEYYNDNSHLTDSISTLARQHWWRRETGQSYDTNVRFEPLTDEQTYLDARSDAWRTVYGDLDGYKPDGFWRDARDAARRDPQTLAQAILSGENVGLIQLDPERSASEQVGYIPFLYVSPAWRGKELGVQLLGHAVGYYRPLGRTKLQLSVAKQNAAALHFYDKHGFRPVGKTRGAHGDLLLMEKNIDLKQYGI